MNFLRSYLYILSFFTILLSFSTPMTMFLHYLALAELTARANAEVFYPVAGILWVCTVVSIFVGYLPKRPKLGKFWVVPISVLNNWAKYYVPEDSSKVVIVTEVKNETTNN